MVNAVQLVEKSKLQFCWKHQHFNICSSGDKVLKYYFRFGWVSLERRAQKKMQWIYFIFPFAMRAALTSRGSAGDGHRAVPQGALAKLGEAASWEERCGQIASLRKSTQLTWQHRWLRQQQRPQCNPRGASDEPEASPGENCRSKRTLQSLKNNLMPTISESRHCTGQIKS